jgi:hypothetical protein
MIVLKIFIWIKQKKLNLNAIYVTKSLIMSGKYVDLDAVMANSARNV